MASQIVCNVTSRETRVAFLENRVITELFVERVDDQGFVGNIYKGVVTKVLPGMQVAFVDIGLPKAGFLYVGDVESHAGPLPYVSDEGGEESLRPPAPRTDYRKISELLTEGETVMVQVSKDPMGTKGARITTYTTLPGRYLVFMPTIDQVGVSRRIESEEENRRLRDTVRRLKLEGTGYIVRTAAEGKEEIDLEHDICFLDKIWESIGVSYGESAAPGLVYRELNLVQRTIRDRFSSDVSTIIIDNVDAYEKTIAFCQSYLPGIVDKVELYEGKEPIFDVHGLEVDIERALERNVWLKSGGSIVIDQTEALTAIDVNTGKFVGKVSPEETILKTNLEAVKEIVYQLQLRNIGGLIIIDFIDMVQESSKEKVYAALEEVLKNDRSRTNILKISELGLVEMTRKRVRDSLSRTLTTPCFYCSGRGVIKSPRTVLYEIYREIRRVARRASGTESRILCTVSSTVADLLYEEDSEYLDELERDLLVSIVVTTDASLHQEACKVTIE